jgi:hypothetical protein
MTQKIAINTCFGGFGLSDTAFREWARRKNYGMVVDPHSYGTFFWATPNLTALSADVKYRDYTPDNLISDRDIDRDDKDLVDIISEMGESAYGEHARLRVVEIPDGVSWFIDEYDGREHVAEEHQTWG